MKRAKASSQAVKQSSAPTQRYRKRKKVMAQVKRKNVVSSFKLAEGVLEKRGIAVIKKPMTKHAMYPSI